MCVCVHACVCMCVTDPVSPTTSQHLIQLSILSLFCPPSFYYPFSHSLSPSLSLPVLFFPSPSFFFSMQTPPCLGGCLINREAPAGDLRASLFLSFFLHPPSLSLYLSLYLSLFLSLSLSLSLSVSVCVRAVLEFSSASL